jgi:pantoate--beta-alanine ligase
MLDVALGGGIEMITEQTIAGIRSAIRKARLEGKTIGFVPTMGYLHDGHISLVSIARQHASFQVMSIFVNRLQFNDPSDFNTYPRELRRDLDMAEEAGVDLVFTPDDSEMYHAPLTHVDMVNLTDHLCGAARPGHFRGVFTVVSKLFNIVQPDVAVFGQKDIQQAIGIEKMVADLNFPVRIIIAPIIRERSGLAMSSRNKHLSEDERKRALAIHASLKRAEAMIQSGERACGKLIDEIRDTLEQGRPDSIDYISAVDYQTLQPASEIGERNVIAIAAFFGKTRLIDNMIVTREERGYACVY